jgi:hypothetical protein
MLSTNTCRIQKHQQNKEKMVKVSYKQALTGKTQPKQTQLPLL